VFLRVDELELGYLLFGGLLDHGDGILVVLILLGQLCLQLIDLN